MKPYRLLPIRECGEPLASLEGLGFILTTPHPYAAFGAPYGAANPWTARKSVVQALETALAALKRENPEWTFRIFDAYRPNTIQSFMVVHEFMSLSGGRRPDQVPADEAAALWERTYRIWAEPSEDPRSPPPHATGAAIDLTLCTRGGVDIAMGSPIDENSDRSFPDYFCLKDPVLHGHRLRLLEVMHSAGFERHPEEWWHFSLGDQMWAFTRAQKDPSTASEARYGRADLL